MSLLHDAYTALLTGLTYKIGKEIHWYDEYKNPITIEPIDTESERYIIRNYYSNNQKHSEVGYQGDQLHGKWTKWYRTGSKFEEIDWQNGYLHGKSLG
jgi:antitoxin component YwqK of YwqJK toxin-antitoxin module